MKRFIKPIISLLLLIVMLTGVMTSCGRKKEYVKLTIEGLGDIVIQLDYESAPKTCENFVKLVDEGFYDGLTFHRVIENFMIQGGCPKADGTGNAGYTIPGEFFYNGWANNHINHTRGVVSMARGGYSMDSASCQFFIVVADYPSLNGQYAAFGYVIEGMDVVDAIVEGTAHLAISNGMGIPKESQARIEKAESFYKWDN